MSLQTIVWAMNQQVFPSSRRYVLVALANFASDTGLAYPCVDTICHLTGQDPKTVRSNLKGLVDTAILVDTGKRTGPTGQVKVYRFPTDALPNQRLPKTDTFEDGKVGVRRVQDGRKTGVSYPKTGSNPVPVNSNLNNKESEESPARPSAAISCPKGDQETAPPVAPPPQRAFHDLIMAYAAVFEAQVGEKYSIDDKDYRKAKEMTKRGIKPEDVTRVAEMGFGLDGFLRDVSMSFTGMASRMNDIRAKAKLGNRVASKGGERRFDRAEDIPVTVYRY